MKKLIFLLIMAMPAIWASARVSSACDSTYCNATAQPADSALNELYVYIDQPPQFPGGDGAMLRYVAMNLRYPPEAMERHEQGMVVLQFVVTSEGNVGEVKVLQSVSQELDKEAIRVIKSLPKFVPGRNNGKPADTWVTFPVTFRM